MKILTFIGYDSHNRPVFTDEDGRYICDTKNLGFVSTPRFMDFVATSLFYKVDSFDSVPEAPVNDDVTIQNLSIVLPPNDGTDYRPALNVLGSDWRNILLEDDWSSFGGISRLGETLGDFLDGEFEDSDRIVKMQPLDFINKMLVECGIKPIKEVK
jgi:hypothetical protein